MSNTIDQKVVEMRFDNKHFESNVSTTMSSLEKLKQSLKFTDSSKGLENVSNAAKKVDMSNLGGAVDTVHAKFSALQVMGVTALANITNSAVNAGKRIVSALTIDPVKTGLQEYETQINAVQTILANTESKGTTIDDVNAALEELNKYADMTIYNFTEMTRNIGTFTAAGVDLETSTNAIKGIANLAAVSGSTSQQASTAMYQLSQALSSGTVKLMDWNSVVNAGMGGQVFQDALKETARVHGVAIDSMIEEQGSFRETLSEGWLTSEILTDTLQKFTLTTEGLTEAQIEQNREMLRSKGYTEEQIEGIFKLGNTATNAATKVKTFTQLWDVLKEAAQSGWSQTWKLIIGDFEEAKALFTPLSEFLTGFINKMSDARNRVLEIALDFAKPWTALTDKLGAVKKVAESVEKVTDRLEYFQDVVNKVWRGDYKNSDTGRFELLEAAGYNSDVVQDLVNKGYDYKLTMEDIEASHKKFGLTMEKTAEETVKTTETFNELTDEKLKDAGLTEDEIALYRAMEKEASRLGISVSELADEMSKNNGRALLIESFKNFGDIFIGIGKAAKEAWVDIFNPPGVEVIGIRLYGLIKSLTEFSEKLRLTDKETGKLTENGDKIVRTLKGVFAILDIITTIIGGGFKIAFKVVSQILSYFNLNILDVTAAIGDAIVNFKEWFDSIFNIYGVLDILVPLVKRAARAISNFFSSFKETIGSKAIGEDIISGLVTGLKGGANKVYESVVEIAKGLIAKFKEILGIHSPSTVFMAIGGFIIAGLLAGLSAAFPQVRDALAGFGEKCIDVLGKIDFGSILAGFVAVGSTIAMTKVGNALESFAAPFEGLGEVLGGTGKVLRKSAGGIKKILLNTAKVVKSFSKVLNAVAFNIRAEGIKTLATSLLMLVGAVIVLTFIDETKLWNATGVILVLAGVLAGLAWAVGRMSNSATTINKDGASLDTLPITLAGIGAAILMLGLTVKLIGSMNPEQAKQGFLGLAGAIVAMGLVLITFGKFVKGKSAQNIDKLGVMLVKMSVALLLMAAVVKIAGHLTDDEMLQAGKFLLGFAAFAAVMNVIALMPSKNVGKLGGMILKMSLALILMVAVVKLAGELTPDELDAGVEFLSMFSLFVLGLVAISTIGGNRIEGLGKMLLGVSASMLILVGVMKLIGMLSPSEIGIGLLVISAFAVILGLLVKSVLEYESEAPKVAATILAFSVAIGIMAVVAAVLSLIKTENLIKGVAAVAVFAVLIRTMITATRDANDVKGNLIAITVAIGIMAAAVAALSFLDPVRLAIATAALGSLMYIFGLVAKMAGTAQKAMGSLIVMTVAVAAIGIILYKLAELPVESVLGSAVALSVALLSLVGALAILSKIGPMASAAYPAMLALAALIGVLSAVVVAAGLLSKIPGFNELIADGGGTLALIGSAIGGFVGSIVAGFAGAVLNILPMLGLALSGFMAGALPFIAGLKLVDAKMLAGVGILAATILALTAAEFISGLVSLGGIGLVALGASLSGFIMAALPFIRTAAQITPEMVAGVKSLAETILILTAADLLDGLNLFGKSSLESFATQLPLLGRGLSSFISSIGTFSEDQLNTVKCAANAIKTLAQASSEIPNSGGLLGDIVGNNDLGTFAEQFPILGSGLSKFLNNVGTFTEDQVDTVECASNAIKLLAQASSEIPNSGGLLGALVGNNDMSTFAEQFPILGTGLSKFLNNVGTFTEDQIATVECAANALKILAVASSEIPNSGGWVGKIVGENDLGTFAEQFPKLGEGLKGFVDKLGVFSDEKISTIETAVLAIKAVAKLSDTNLYGAMQNMADYGEELVGFGGNLAKFCTSISAVDGSTIASAIGNVDKLVKMVENVSGLDKNAASNFTNAIKELGKSGVDKFVSEFTSVSAKTDVKKAAKNLVDSAIEGIEAKLNALKNAYKDLITDSIPALESNSNYRKFKNAGKYLGDGLIEGIEAKEDDVYDAAYALGQAAVQGEKDGQASNSPSKLTILAGKWLGEGLVIGIQKMGSKVYDAGHDLGSTATRTISSAVSKVADMVNSDIDAQPTIRPVLDLSDVESGANYINGMFGNASVGVMSNVGAINSMMNRRSQNGVNGEVVTAIDKLRKDLGNVGGNTYNINGVSAEEGSDVAEAIKVIVRAAKVERRT